MNARAGQTWTHHAIAIPVAVSVLVHAAAGLALYGVAAPRDLTDVSAPAIEESVLAFAPEPEIADEPPPVPPQTESQPDPQPRSVPEVKEPLPETQPPPPVRSLAPPLIAPKLVARPAPAAPATTPAPVPAPLEPVGAPSSASPATPEESRPHAASFAGVAGDPARRIVYVVDASGSMATSLPFVRQELIRSVSRLKATQSFQVIVVREPPGEDGPSGSPEVRVFEPFQGGASRGSAALVPASDVAAAELAGWLETIGPLGRSAPLAGLEGALKLEPDLVFLLSRSIRRSGPATGPAVESVLAELDRANPRGATGARKAMIKAVQFVDDDPTGLMQAIGEEHGGRNGYRVLKVAEFAPERAE